MPKHLQKSLKKCLSNLKKCPSNIQLQYSSSFSTSKNWVLSSCKHPKTLSFAVYCDQNDNSSSNNNNINNDGAATLSDIDRFLFENFKSLYLNDEDDNKKKEECDEDKIPNGALFDSPRFIEPPRIRQGSHRFFLAPGFSGSLIEEAPNSFTNYDEDMAGSTSTSTSTSTTALNDHSSTVSTDSKYVKLPGDSITILRYSPSPYSDFQRSMQEMVEARLQHQATVDWDFLEELFFFYVRLNEKKSYKFILRAFVDLVVGLRQNSNKIPARSRHDF